MRWYWILGFQQAASLGQQIDISNDEIERAYISGKSESHLSPAQVAELDTAYAVLGHPLRRRNYDACMLRHFTEREVDRHKLVAQTLIRPNVAYFKYLLENVLHGQGFDPLKLQEAIESLKIKSLDLSHPWLVDILNSRCSPEIQFKLTYFFWQQFKFTFNAEHLDLINVSGLTTYFFKQYQVDALVLCLTHQHSKMLSALPSQLKDSIFSVKDNASLVFKAWFNSKIEWKDFVQMSFSVLAGWGLVPSYELLLEALVDESKYSHLSILSEYMYRYLIDSQLNDFLKKVIYCDSQISLSNIFLGMFKQGLRGLTVDLLIEADKKEGYSRQGRFFLYAVAQSLRLHPDTPGVEFIQVLEWCRALTRTCAPYSFLKTAANAVFKIREPEKFSGSKRAAHTMSSFPVRLFQFHDPLTPQTGFLPPPECVRTHQVKQIKTNDKSNRNSKHNIQPPSP